MLLAVTLRLVLLPLQMTVLPEISLKVTAGAFTVTVTLLLAVAVQTTSLVFTVAVTTTV